MITDFVYPWVDGPALFDELKYSLRSLEKHYKGEFRVIIIGDKPDWITNVLHIPIARQSGMHENLTYDAIWKMMRICDGDEVGDCFVRMYDDIYLIKDVDFDEISKIKAIWNYSDKTKDDLGLSSSATWTTQLVRTLEALKADNLPTWNTETHLPEVFMKSVMKWVLQEYNALENRFLTSTLYYNNVLQADELPYMVHRNTGIKAGFYDKNTDYSYHSNNYREIEEICAGKQYLNHNDAGATEALRNFIKKTFSKASRFEKTSEACYTPPAPPREGGSGGFSKQQKPMNELNLDIVRWLKAGCDYQQGVALFGQYSTNKVLFNILGKGFPKHEKLQYELIKISGLPAATFTDRSILDGIVLKSTPSLPPPRDGEEENPQEALVEDIPMPELLDPEDQDNEKLAELRKKWATYPRSLQDIVVEKSKLSNERHIAYTRLQNIPEDNTDENIAKRLPLMEVVQECSAKIQALQRIVDAFDSTGELISTTPTPLLRGEKGGKRGKVAPDVENLDEAKLIKKELNIMVQVSKYKNLVKESSGPLKVKYEECLAERERWLQMVREQKAKIQAK